MDPFPAVTAQAERAAAEIPSRVTFVTIDVQALGRVGPSRHASGGSQRPHFAALTTGGNGVPYIDTGRSSPVSIERMWARSK